MDLPEILTEACIMFARLNNGVQILVPPLGAQPLGGPKMSKIDCPRTPLTP